jgi:hypothetical protein
VVTGQYVADEDNDSRVLYVTSGVLGGALSDILNGVISGIIVNILDSLFGIKVGEFSENLLVIIFLSTLCIIWLSYWVYSKLTTIDYEGEYIEVSGKPFIPTALYVQAQTPTIERRSSILSVSKSGLVGTVLLAGFVGSITRIPFGFAGAAITGGIVGLIVVLWKTRSSGEPFK